MSDSTMSVNSNVTIKCIDKYGRVTRVSRIHNKANIQMVEGLLRYLLGDFTPSAYNTDTYTPEGALDYLPSEVRFGTIGVEMTHRDTDQPVLNKIDSSIIKKPTFDDFKLQEEICLSELKDDETWSAIVPVIKFESADLTTFDDPNNSMGLLLRVFIPAGQLVRAINDKVSDPYIYFIDKNVDDPDKGRVSEGWVYYNPKRKTDTGLGDYEATFTEIGLYSKTGMMLARVALDGKVLTNSDGTVEFDSSGELVYDDAGYENNPITQTESSSLIVEWRIGIVSIGQNDEIISGADLKNLGGAIDIIDGKPDPVLVTFENIPKEYVQKVHVEGEDTYTVEIPQHIAEEYILEAFSAGIADPYTVDNLNFSSGDMDIVLETPKLINKIIIKKPENLDESNILEGVDIAGIMGALNHVTSTDEISYLTEAPTEDNTSGNLRVVVLREEPDQRYEGYLYLIIEAN